MGGAGFLLLSHKSWSVLWLTVLLGYAPLLTAAFLTYPQQLQAMLVEEGRVLVCGHATHALSLLPERCHQIFPDLRAGAGGAGQAGLCSALNELGVAGQLIAIGLVHSYLHRPHLHKVGWLGLAYASVYACAYVWASLCDTEALGALLLAGARYWFAYISTGFIMGELTLLFLVGGRRGALGWTMASKPRADLTPA